MCDQAAAYLQCRTPKFGDDRRLRENDLVFAIEAVPEVRFELGLEHGAGSREAALQPRAQPTDKRVVGIEGHCREPVLLVVQ